MDVAGSGVTGDLLAHSIDTAMWLNGPITRVVAKTETFVKERHARRDRQDGTGGDRRRVHVHWRSSRMARWGRSNRLATRAGRKNFNTFELNGADGSVYFDLEEPEYLQFFEYKQLQSGKKLESHLTGWRKIHVTNSRASVYEPLLGSGARVSATSTRFSMRWRIS